MCGWCLDGGIPTGDGTGVRRWDRGGKTSATRPDRASKLGAITSGRFIKSTTSLHGPEPPNEASEASWVCWCETAETTLSCFSATSREKQSETGKLQNPLLMGLLEVMSRLKCTGLLM